MILVGNSYVFIRFTNKFALHLFELNHSDTVFSLFSMCFTPVYQRTCQAIIRMRGNLKIFLHKTVNPEKTSTNYKEFYERVQRQELYNQVFLLYSNDYLLPDITSGLPNHYADIWNY